MMEVKIEYKMTAFGEIPIEWENTDFLNVFKSVPTKKYQIPNTDILEAGFYEVIDQGKKNIAGYSDEKEKLFEDVPAIIYGDHTTVVKYREKPFVLGADGTKLIKVRNNYNTKYGYYLLDHFNISPEGYKRHYSIVKEIKLPFTKNKNEQQKIAEILSTVDEQIEQTDQLIEKTKELKKGLMQQLLTKGIGHTAFKQSEFGEIPVGWEMLKLGDSCEIIMGQSPKGESYNDEKKGFPLLNGPTEFGDKYPKIIQWTTQPTKFCKDEDILFCVRGSSIGRMNIANQQYCIGRGLAAIRQGPATITQYINYILQLHVVNVLKNTTGSTFPNITKDELKSFILPLPNLDEQKKIVGILSSVDNNIEEYEEEKKKYEELKKGLMQQLLTGKTRVKVD